MHAEYNCRSAEQVKENSMLSAFIPTDVKDWKISTNISL